jgi:hypothetical protein
MTTRSLAAQTKALQSLDETTSETPIHATPEGIPKNTPEPDRAADKEDQEMERNSLPQTSTRSKSERITLEASHIKDTISEEIQENIAASQRQDLWTNQMIQYLENKELPEDVTRAREILTTNTKFFIDLQTKVLYREHQPNPKSSPDLIYEQLVLPNSAVEEVLRQAHDIPHVGAHRGHAQVYLALAPHVYFDKMYACIKNYVQSCTVCAKHKSPR